MVFEVAEVTSGVTSGWKWLRVAGVFEVGWCG